MGIFTVQLQAIAAKTQQKLDDFVGLVVIGVAARLDYRSPIGDAVYWTSKPPPGYVGGRFRANWQLGVGHAPGGEINAVDRSAKDPDRGGDTTARILVGLPVEGKRAGPIYYLVNNVPYADRIEHGWSRQAPTGLVALTATEFQALANRAAEAVKT